MLIAAVEQGPIVGRWTARARFALPCFAGRPHLAKLAQQILVELGQQAHQIVVRAISRMMSGTAHIG
jgi:hypothetical protein